MNLARKTYLRYMKKMTFLPSKIFLPFLYEYFTKKKLNLKNPIEFNEKIQWYKIYFRPKILNQLIDKYAVKAYVKEKIGEEYLNETIAVFDKVSSIDFSNLPDKFVVKATHTNQQNLIVKDKNKIQLKKLTPKFRKWFFTNQYYKNGKEWGYKNIKPRIIVEKFLIEEGKDDLTDYKFFCFSGKPKFVEVHINRGTNYKREIYDMNFERLPFNKGNKSNQFDSSIPKPLNFNNMVEVAKKLSEDFPFVRVDLYAIEEKTIFGELTFYPADGRKDFYPNKYNKVIGDYFELPKIPKGKKVITTLDKRLTV
jgi:hypothetical protein